MTALYIIALPDPLSLLQKLQYCAFNLHGCRENIMVFINLKDKQGEG